MTGYCEACLRETQGEPDEYGINVCIDCGCDLIPSVHVEVDGFIVSVLKSADFNDFLNRD